MYVLPTERGQALPVPRVPSTVRLDRTPTPEDVKPLDRKAAEVIATMRTLVTDAHAAVQAVVSARYGGPEWEAAAALDEADLTAGRPPTALAELIRGEADRYALAVAEAATITARFDAARAAGQAHLDDAAEALAPRITELAEAIASSAPAAWALIQGPRKGAGLAAAERVVDLYAEAQGLLALRDWLTGHDRQMDRSGGKRLPGLTPQEAGYFIACRAAVTDRWPLGSLAGVELPEDYAPRVTGTPVVAGR